MKRNPFKILILALCVILALSLCGCSYLTETWNYIKGKAPLFSQIPPNTNITVNQGTVPTQTGGIATVIESTKPSIVEVYTTYRVTKDGQEKYGYMFGNGVILHKTTNGLYIVSDTQLMLDSISQDDLIYTKMFVTVRFSTGIESRAEIRYRDMTADVALLFVDKANIENYFDIMATATVSKTIQNGNKVFVLGNPYGNGNFGVCATTGVISTIGREMGIGDDRVVTLIQTDAEINVGNTGCGLFDKDGKLIGIVKGKIMETGVEGLGFALPIEKALQILHNAGYLQSITV